MRPEDVCTHLGDEYDAHLGAISPPIYQTSLFTRKRGAHGYSYSRTNNPTVEIAERKIAALEGAESGLCFSSGMAAITAAMLHIVSSGNHVIAPRSVYLPVRTFLTQNLARLGVRVSFVSGDNIEEIEAAIEPDTTLIYLETPVSNVFALQDLRAVSRLARARGIKTIADNSWATPIFQNPHDLGIDIVVHSASKYLGGHSDIVAGALTADTDTVEAIRHGGRGLYGSVIDPHQAWLLVRSLRTLPLRMKAHQSSAMEIASFLEAHRRIQAVYYPGLKSHVQHELATRQMQGTTGLLSFTLDCDDSAVRTFVDCLELFEVGPSWGGYESLLNTPGVGIDEDRSRETGIPRGLIRVSIGLEHVSSLIDDLDQALSRI